MIERIRHIYSNTEIERILANRDLSVGIQTFPRTPINTDNIGACYLDWSLEYWTRPKSPYEVLSYCLNLEDIKKIIKIVRFFQVEAFIRGLLCSLEEAYDIKCVKSEVVEDHEDQEEMLLVQVFVDKKDPKQIIELWKEISTKIRSEIDREFGEKSRDIQLRLWISVKPIK